MQRRRQYEFLKFEVAVTTLHKVEMRNGHFEKSADRNLAVLFGGKLRGLSELAQVKKQVFLRDARKYFQP